MDGENTWLFQPESANAAFNFLDCGQYINPSLLGMIKSYPNRVRYANHSTTQHHIAKRDGRGYQNKGAIW